METHPEHCFDGRKMRGTSGRLLTLGCLGQRSGFCRQALDEKDDVIALAVTKLLGDCKSLGKFVGFALCKAVRVGDRFPY